MKKTSWTKFGECVFSKISSGSYSYQLTEYQKRVILALPHIPTDFIHDMIFPEDVVTTEKIKVQRRRPSIPSVSQGGWRAASLFWNLRQSASQNLSKKNIAVLTAPSFLERFCEADWRNS